MGFNIVSESYDNRAFQVSLEERKGQSKTNAPASFFFLREQGYIKLEIIKKCFPFPYAQGHYWLES